MLNVSQAFSQNTQSNIQTPANNDIRAFAVDIHLSLNRENTPESVAFKLSRAVQLFRGECTSVTDFQIYTKSQNLTAVKVKCAAMPLYGVNVGSNGYMSVYGGDGIIAGLDRRDGVIYSFGLDGKLEPTDGITIEGALDETAARLQSGDAFSPIYILLFIVAILIIIALSVVLSLGLWRRRSSRKDADAQQFTRRVSKETKDQLTNESKELFANIYKHPSGTYIVRGKSGHRRFFSSLFWALAYKYLRSRIFEVGAPQPLQTNQSNK